METPQFKGTFLDALLEAGRAALEPGRERLERDRGELWQVTVSASHRDPASRSFGDVELVGRPSPPDDRKQWAVLEIFESAHPGRVHLNASLNACDDNADMAAHEVIVSEQLVLIADAPAAIAAIGPTLERALYDLLAAYEVGWRWLADLRSMPDPAQDAVIPEFVQSNPVAADVVGDALLYSRLPADRRLGATILGFVAEREPTKRIGIYSKVLSRVSGESDPGALAAILIAAGRLGDPQALGAVQRFAGHPDPGVRAAVVFALPRLDPGDDSGS